MVSILIANYNNAKYFEECFQSLINQSYQDFEVIILDDHSNDNSFELINKLIRNDIRFKFYQNDENKGIGFTKRKLVTLSNTSICGFLDPDDTLESNAIEVILDAHLKHNECGLIYSNFTFCDAFLNPVKIHFAKQINSLDDEYYNFYGEISHFATFKKSIYNKTSGIDPFFKIAEDKDWYMKMCEVGPVKHINVSLYNYRVHSGGISTNNTNRALFWHWIALIKMAERRGVILEDLFFEKFTIRNKQSEREIEEIKKSFVFKLIKKIGLFNS